MRRLALAVLASLAIVATLAFGLSKHLADRPRTADDQALIKDTVEGATEVRGEACLERSHGQEQYFKDQLAQYFSDEPPTGGPLQTREAHYERFYGTPDPTVVGYRIATVEAKVTAGITTVTTGTLLALHDLQANPPTPNWDPDDSPLGDRHKQIDECQADYGRSGMSLDFGVIDYDYQHVTIDGDQAEVLVEITMWGEKRTPTGTTGPITGTQRTTFHLERQNGSWRITGEEVDFTW